MFRTYELEPEIAVNGIRGGGMHCQPVHVPLRAVMRDVYA